ncbi:MAG TPA: hypothetical protein VHW25_12645 [Steroidobacteraceae bacterium]|jgi:hypothetical protein|nr:hypothetical protein [Steroidobacteraceae bacterium]
MITREQALEIALDWLTRQLRDQLAAVDDFVPDSPPSKRTAELAGVAIPAFLKQLQPDGPDPESPAPTATAPMPSAHMEHAASDAEAWMLLTRGQRLQREMERWKRPAPPGVPGRRVWRVRVAQEHLSTNMPPDILIDAETGEIVADPWHVLEG